MTRRHSSMPWTVPVILCLITLALSGLYWVWTLHLTEDGVPLDDAWIYFQFARMGAQGHFGEFNQGEAVTGITGPLWAAMLVPLHALAGDNVPLFLALVKTLGILLLFLSALTVYQLGEDLFQDRRAGMAAAVFLLLMPKIIWGALSGMEVPLLVLLELAIFRLIIWQEGPGAVRDIVIPVLIGLAALTRPEAAFLFVIFAGYELLTWWQDGRPQGVAGLLPGLILQGLIFLLVLSPNLLFNFLTTGKPLPNTFYAKTRGWDPVASLRFLGIGLSMVWLDPPATATMGEILRWPPLSPAMAIQTAYSLLKGLLLFALFLLGLVRLPKKRRALPALAWLVGDFLLYAVLFTRANRHYFVPMLPPIALMAGGGMVAIIEQAARRRWRPAWAAGLIALFLLAGTVDWAREYAWNVKNINDQQVAIGKWAAHNLPPDAVLAINDVGAIKYFSQRRIIDVTGLLTPDLIPYIQAGRKMDYLRAASPDYLIVYDSWFPEARAWEGFKWVRDFVLEKNTIAGGDVVRVYQVLSFPPAGAESY